MIVTQIMDTVNGTPVPEPERIAVQTEPLDQLYLPTSLKGYLAEALNAAVLFKSTDSCSQKWHHESSPRYTPSNRC